jgi:hypothetical protein
VETPGNVNPLVLGSNPSGPTKFLRKEIPDLLSRDDALLSLCKGVLYRNLDASKEADKRLREILMRRYGFECVSKTWWAQEVRDRVRAIENETAMTTNCEV